METVTLVRVLGTVVCLTGLVLCWYIRRTRFEALSSEKEVSVANVRLTQSAFWKLLAFVGIVLCAAGRDGRGELSHLERHAQSLGVRQLPHYAADGQRYAECCQ